MIHACAESVEVQPVQLLPDDFAGMWPSAYSRELRNGKYMRFGRASTIPRYLLDDKDMQLEGIDRGTLEFLELVATERSIPERARRLLIKFALRRLARRANDAKVLTASSKFSHRWGEISI